MAAMAAQRSALGDWMDWIGLHIPRADNQSLGRSGPVPRPRKPRHGKTSRRQSGALVDALRARGGATATAKPPKPAADSCADMNGSPAGKVPLLPIRRAGEAYHESSAPSTGNLPGGFAALHREFMARGTPRASGSHAGHAPSPSPHKRASYPGPAVRDGDLCEAPLGGRRASSGAACSRRHHRRSSSATSPSVPGPAAYDQATSRSVPPAATSLNNLARWLRVREPLIRFDRRAWEFPASTAEKREMLLLTVLAEERARRKEITEGLLGLLEALGYDYLELPLHESESESASGTESMYSRTPGAGSI